MKVYLSIDEAGWKRNPQAKTEIVKVRKRTAKGWRGLEVRDAARLIGKEGYTVIPGKMAGGMKAENCKAMQVFMLDFDDGVRYREIEQKCQDIGLSITFAYHTFSSTGEKERFRVAFVHESLIEDPFIIKTALRMLKSIFPECDKQCSNPDRMFYGGKGLICLNEEATFALVQLLLPFLQSLDHNKNYTRKDDMGNLEGNPLKYLVERENIEEILQCLTERQKIAVSLCFFQQKTQREAAKELGITSPAVSAILSQAARRLRKKYPSKNQAEKAVVAV